jgi:hypothetical protein
MLVGDVLELGLKLGDFRVEVNDRLRIACHATISRGISKGEWRQAVRWTALRLAGLAATSILLAHPNFSITAAAF